MAEMQETSHGVAGETGCQLVKRMQQGSCCPQLVVELLPNMVAAWNTGEVLMGFQSERFCSPGGIGRHDTAIPCRQDGIDVGPGWWLMDGRNWQR